MTRNEAIRWIINLSEDIGKPEHQELWHYEQTLSEIRELLESDKPSTQPISETDLIELEDRFGGYVRFIVEDMINGKEERWTS